MGDFEYKLDVAQQAADYHELRADTANQQHNATVQPFNRALTRTAELETQNSQLVKLANRADPSTHGSGNPSRKSSEHHYTATPMGRKAGTTSGNMTRNGTTPITS